MRAGPGVEQRTVADHLRHAGLNQRKASGVQGPLVRTLVAGGRFRENHFSQFLLELVGVLTEQLGRLGRGKEFEIVQVVVAQGKDLKETVLQTAKIDFARL